MRVRYMIRPLSMERRSPGSLDRIVTLAGTTDSAE
jgi:hypothetical protein